jgi:hypothetical protein
MTNTDYGVALQMNIKMVTFVGLERRFVKRLLFIIITQPKNDIPPERRGSSFRLRNGTVSLIHLVSQFVPRLSVEGRLDVERKTENRFSFSKKNIIVKKKCFEYLNFEFRYCPVKRGSSFHNFQKRDLEFGISK